MVRRRVQAGSSILEFASEEVLATPVIAALYHAAEPSAGEPTLRYRIERSGSGWIGLAPARAPYGPARLEEVFTFLEWRATEDLLAQPGTRFLHAAGIRIGHRSVLLVGESGAGKSTLAAHLLVRGHQAWGDDLVRFALRDRRFSSSPRSWKLDSKALVAIYLLSFLSAEATPGMLLAPGVLYASPAAIRRSWQAPDAPADVVVLLDQADHSGPARLERTSDGSAALRAARMLIGKHEGEQSDTMIQLLEAMSGVTAYRARGSSPGALASALEQELAA